MNPSTAEQRRQIFRQLMHGFRAAACAPADTRWAWLEAAHVVGQPDFFLHWTSHKAMLGLAARNGDLREAAGQVLRLALVPLGHLLQGLPAGNTGRATVSAFAPMAVDARLSALIRQAAAERATF